MEASLRTGQGKAWLAENGQKIEVFYLSNRSPELSLDEWLNEDLKQIMDSKVAARTQTKLHAEAVAHMQQLQKERYSFIVYFQDLYVQLVA